MGSWKDKLLRVDEIQRQARETVERTVEQTTQVTQDADPQALLDEAQQALDRLGRQTRVELEAADAPETEEAQQRPDQQQQQQPNRNRRQADATTNNPAGSSDPNRRRGGLRGAVEQVEQALGEATQDQRQQREDRRATGARLLQRIEDARAELTTGGVDAARNVLDSAVNEARNVGLRVDTPSLPSSRRPPEPKGNDPRTNDPTVARGANPIERLRDTVLGGVERNLPTELAETLRSEATDLARETIEQNLPG